jgi:serine/threonine-protein kinase ULK/ATG1
MMMATKKRINGFILDQEIGHGSFAVVYKGYHESDPTAPVAIKHFKAEQYEEPQAKALLLQELQSMAELESEHVIKIKAAYKTPSGNMYAVMEFCSGGSVMEAIKREGPIPEDIVKRWLQELISAFDELERKNIMHRDIKSDNILITDPNLSQAHIKIADFGLSKRIGIDEVTNTFLGSPLYMAPEIGKNLGYNFKADIWSLGLVLFEMLTATRAYEVASFGELGLF